MTSLKRKMKEAEVEDEIEEPAKKIVDRKSVGDAESEGIDGVDAPLPSYDLKKSKHTAYIFSNFKGRNGSTKDARAMVNLFKDNLKFQVVCPNYSDDPPVFADLTGQSFKETIRIISGEDYAEHGGIAVILMTHGKANGKLLFHGEDGSENTAEVDIQKDVIQPFLDNPNNLTGKPKIFIILACRGERHHAGLEVDDRTDGNTFGLPKTIVSLPKNSDVIVVYPTSEGQVAMRDNENGSWYVQTFVEVVKKHHKKEHFLDLLTEVNRRVAQKVSQENGTTTNMPDFESSLRKKLYFK